MGEARERVQGMRLAGAEPPLLALGVFERVGSNWFVDSLRPCGVVHNEPFRQQLHPTHPLSVLNSASLTLDQIDQWDWEPYAWHWLVTFVVSKYGTPSHTVKETNLFFTVDRLLGMFPDAPIVVLSRSPVGITSSFARGRLFKRWGYEDRYELLATAVTRPEHAAYRCVLPVDQPGELRKLTRMIVLNALALAGAVHDHRFAHLAYEQALVNQAAALSDAARMLGDRRLARAPGPTAPAGRPAAVDNTYSTRQIGTQAIHLDPDEARLVRREVETRLAAAATELPATHVDRAAGWLSADPAPARFGGRPQRVGAVRPSTPTPPGSTVSATVDTRYTSRQATPGLLWRAALVTNSEFRVFLDAMRHAGVPNLVAATALFGNDAMPHERGGRIHPDPAGVGHVVSPGYENHPVYWVTWVGAAAFARWVGARLPTRAELDRLAKATTVDLDSVNADYRIGDVTPVGDDGPVGNLQLWCADGPTRRGDGPVSRYLYGAAWNTPATWTEIRRRRSRHITGCSRGIGIQLVVPTHRFVEPQPATLIARDLRRALDRLGDRGRSLPALDAELVRATTGYPESAGCG